MSISERQKRCIDTMRLEIAWAHLYNPLELGFRDGQVPQINVVVPGNLEMRFGK